MGPLPHVSAGAAALILAAAPAAGVQLRAPCKTAIAGELCYEEVQWALQEGMASRPELYPNLTKESTFEELQLFLHGLDEFSDVCPKPCARTERPCHTAVQGEPCYDHLMWAMQKGIVEHPNWYPTLSRSSSFDEFQLFLSGLEEFAGECARPCAAARNVCSTAVKGDRCYDHVMWAMREGIVAHPEWHPTLTRNSSFEEFQLFLSGLDEFADACARPCEAQKATCSIAVKGDRCYEKVMWLMHEGIEQHPDWYPTLTRASSFEEVQLAISGLDHFRGVCPRPCEVARKTCSTVVKGDRCYDHVIWAMQKGIVAHPGWYPTLTGSSSFEDFQMFLSGLEQFSGECPKPCQGQKACRTAIPGEQCYSEVLWAMQKGVLDHPEWYAPLTKDSSFEEFQTFLRGLDGLSRVCATPCEARVQGCRTAVQGDECYRNVAWSMTQGMALHPEWYPGLTNSSSPEDFQEFLHGLSDLRLVCPKPCRAPPSKAGSEEAQVDDEIRAAEAEQPPQSREALENQSVRAPALQQGKEEAEHTQEVASEQAGVERPALEDARQPETEQRSSVDHESDQDRSESSETEQESFVRNESVLHERQSMQEKPAQSVASSEDQSVHAPAAKQAAEEAEFTQALPVPLQPGCYVWQPSRCPRRAQMGARSEWKRDAWGEENVAAGESEQACLSRKSQFDSFCGTRSSRMHFVPKAAPNTTNRRGDEPDAVADATAEAAAAAAALRQPVGEADVPATKVGQEVLGQPHSEAGAAGATAAPKVRPVVPSGAGCFVWMPSGCPRGPRQLQAAERGWRRDAWGEEHKDAARDPLACQQRKATFDHWCQTADAVMLRVPPKPARRGCYVWQPSACPLRGQTEVPSAWVRDSYGEENLGAGADAAACLQRKHSFDSQCGVEDTIVHYAAQDGTMSAGVTREEEEEKRRAPARAGLPAARSREDAPPPPAAAGHSRAQDGEAEEGAPAARAARGRALDDAERRPVPATAADSPVVAQLPEGAPPPPAGHGCFVWLPTGCAKADFRAPSRWKRDQWGEENRRAAYSETACLARKSSFDKWCGVSDAVMLHRPLVLPPDETGKPARQAAEARPAWWSRVVAGGLTEDLGLVPAPPKDMPSGCYYLAPKGCDETHHVINAQWVPWPDKVNSSEACAASKEYFDKWCQQDHSIVIIWIPGKTSRELSPTSAGFATASAAKPWGVALDRPAPPKAPGCYVWYPSGCPRRSPMPPQLEWRIYRFSHESRVALNETGCLARKEAQNRFCGTSDIEMVFVDELNGAVWDVEATHHLPQAPTPSVQERTPTPAKARRLQGNLLHRLEEHFDNAQLPSIEEQPEPEALRKYRG